ncbi:MAG TPA: EscU/YscU/HrcU family type III secretion system export apparatus switch protein, partial [Solirubrobacteraceae bacterium]|nr:EscU/YscU/HrcU family type III secretion system export apparatus switch protein [Solirubrobacteraceae bacterium]
MAGGGAHDKTEKATPKRRDEARKKGQVAKSQDLNGATVMLAGLFTLAVAGSAIAGRMTHAMQDSLAHVADPSVVSRESIGTLLTGALTDTALAVAPVAGACLVAGLLASVIQVGFKPSAKAAAPDPKRINPLNGLKQLLGPNALVEGAKSIVKVAVVGAIVAAALVPLLPQMGTFVGMTPHQLASELVGTIMGIAQRAAVAYLVIGLADVAWQKRRHEKSLRMDKQEVKEEHKQQQLPAEVRMAMRRRQASAARARMMGAVPEADVVVTNPTHFSVALKYDGTKAAPEVVAKGQDLLALRIRELAREHGV